MLAVRTNAGQGRYAVGEWDVVFNTVRVRTKPALLWFHGNNQTALTDYAGYGPELRKLAQDYHVYAADFAGSTFGNDAGIASVVALMDHYDLDTAVLVAASMGVSLALNVARVHPERVDAVAGIIPALDLSADGPGEAQLNAAYPPAYDDNNPTHAAHNPVRFAADLPADLPVALWTSSNDTAVLPATADAFVAARPQTERTVFGAYGHGGVSVAVPLVVEWLRGLS